MDRNCKLTYTQNQLPGLMDPSEPVPESILRGIMPDPSAHVASTSLRTASVCDEYQNLRIASAHGECHNLAAASSHGKYQSIGAACVLLHSYQCVAIFQDSFRILVGMMNIGYIATQVSQSQDIKTGYK